MTTTELAPQFAVTVRGYDRVQVEDYVDTLREWLGNATLRMEAAESENSHLREQVTLLRTRLTQVEHQLDHGPPYTIVAMGDRVARILELAEEGASAARADAEAEAVAIVGRARQEAADLVRAAQGRNDEMEAFVAGAGDKAASLVAHAEVQAASLVAHGEAQATELSNRLQAEAETRAAARETQAAERARVVVAEAETQRQLTLARLEEEQAILRAELLRLTTERDDIRESLTRLRESLHRTIVELPGGESGLPELTPALPGP